ncbi:MAG TPA: alanine racemase [Longimicrobiales bacterium]|nr:alanine racemase [Longimicrobiales bacterium]
MAITPDARAWVEVDLDAVRANYDTVRRAAGRGASVMPMVKADGYGVGAARVVRALESREPLGYGVATAAEGAALRSSGIERPILIVTPLPAGDEDVAARAGLTASISSVDGLDRWVAAADRAGGAPLEFHVEVDTGMGRCGFDWRESGAWTEALRSRQGAAIRWTGIFTHFHGADGPDARATVLQWERFRDTLVQLPVSREDLLVHAANSAAALRFPEFAADAVRPGIFLYGGHPAPEAEGVPAPAPVVALRARIGLIRDVPPGSTVGYGATHVAREWERWGTLLIGYGDGLPRSLGNNGEAVVAGRRVPIVGRVSMDLTVVDLTDVAEAEVGDVATLIGADGSERIALEEVAARAGTIGYEILTGLGQRLPRIETTTESEREGR